MSILIMGCKKLTLEVKMKDIIMEDIINDVEEMSDLQVLKELNIALVPSSANGMVMVIPREIIF